MTASLTSAPPAPAGTPPNAPAPGAGDRRARLRRLRFPLAIAATVVVTAGIAAFATPGGGGTDLDPQSGAPSGSLAVARILEQQGVTVRRVRDPQQTAGEAGTLVVVHPELLSPADLRRLDGGAQRLVVVQPDAVVLDDLAPSVEPAGTAPASTREPRCVLSEAQVGPARAGGDLYRLSGRSRGQVCYPGDDGASSGALVSVDRADGGGARTTVVLGQGDVLTNAHLDEDANAALALRLLGSERTLTWLVPDPLRTGGDGSDSLGSLLPPWVRWVVVQGCLALLLALLWRARRLGPVVPEPLPVAVRSSETLLGRARLYRRARAADRAAATLRTAVARRLAARLAVPTGAGPEAVAVRVAAATGQDPVQVRQVLLGPPPPDERALVRLADELDALERAVGAERTIHTSQQQREGHG